MVNNRVVASFPAFLAGLGNQGRSTDVGVAPPWRVINNSPIFLRSASFFVRSRQVLIRAVVTTTSWKGEKNKKQQHRCFPKGAYVIYLYEWIDSPTLTVAPLVSLVNDIP